MSGATLKGRAGADDVSISDLNPYAILAVRRGLLLRAIETKPGAKKGRPVSRTLREATQLGLRIFENFENYSTEIKVVVRQVAEKYGLNPGTIAVSSREWMRSKYAPGLILDFPAFSFKLGPYSVTGRSCVTICFADSVSKIWTRLILNESVQGVPNREDAGRNFQIGAEICAEINRQLQKMYLDDFRHTIDLHPGAEISFNLVGSLDYYGIDEEPDIINEVTDIVENHHDVEGAGVSLIKDHIAFLSNVAKGERGGNVDADRQFRSGELFPFVNEAGKQALFAADIADTSASFYITAARHARLNGKARKELRRERDSSALDTITELAILLATRF